jgi:hypothetical protein
MFRPLFSITVLALAVGACATPQDLDLSLRHASVQGRYLVQMDPPASAPAINQIHSWQIRISTADGTPVRNARVAVDGGMPQHGHGLPTRPQVRPEADAGAYRMDGMKFSMSGWWTIKLAIEAVDGADTAVFNTVLDSSGARR